MHRAEIGCEPVARFVETQSDPPSVSGSASGFLAIGSRGPSGRSSWDGNGRREPKEDAPGRDHRDPGWSASRLTPEALEQIRAGFEGGGENRGEGFRRGAGRARSRRWRPSIRWT